jgi:hypothetical protein
MTEQLHRLIDGGAQQPVINERVAGLIENSRREIDRIGTDHEKRIRYLERTVAWALGGIGVISALMMIASKVWK